LILQNIARAVINQDWSTLTVEFVVVILGLLIGLQIDDWNQARLNRLEAAYHLEFLYQEQSAASVEAAAALERYDQTLNNSFSASFLLEKDVWSSEERTQFETAIFSTYELWGPKHRPVSLRRMIDGGKLDLIESRDLQMAILDFETAYLEAIEQTKTSYSYSLLHTPVISTSLQFQKGKLISTNRAILSNLELRAAVRNKAIWQRIQSDTLATLQEERLELLEVLKGSLGKAGTKAA
jgi:hypothetical protein